MSNNAAGLNTFLDTMLVDAADVVWASAEKDNVIAWAVAGLWPHISRVFDPTTTTVDLTVGTYYYALPTGVLAVSRVDWLDTNSDERGALANGTWEVSGDPLLGTGLLHVAPVYADQDGTLRLVAYGRYDVTTNLIPDDYVPLVLAEARAECYRRLVGDRARFKEWLSRQQTANTSVNELTQLVQDADRDAGRLRSKFKSWQKPVPGRVG